MSALLEDSTAAVQVVQAVLNYTPDFELINHHSALGNWGKTPSEATLLKIYDSAIDGPARLTAHTAFDDPSSAPNAPPRRSIEVRAAVPVAVEASHGVVVSSQHLASQVGVDILKAGGNAIDI